MLRLPDAPNRESQEICFPRELHPKHFLFRVNCHHLCKSWLELLVTWRTEMIFLFWSVQLSLKEGAEENTEFCYSWDWVNEGKLRVSAFHQISVDQARNHFFPPGLVISYLWYCWDIMSSGSKHWYPRSSSIRKSLHICICIRNNTAHSHACKHSEIFQVHLQGWETYNICIHLEHLGSQERRHNFNNHIKAFPARWGWMLTWEAEAGRLWWVQG